MTQTLNCQHVHDDSCGYAEGDPGAPCTFVCPICPIEDLIASLPGSLSEDNSEQVQAQLSEIYDRYEALTEDEQQQVDLSPCMALLDQLDGMDTAELSDSGTSTSHKLTENKVYDPYGVSKILVLNLNNFTLSGKNSCAIQITAAGTLTIEGAGKVTAPNGAGVEIQSGASLIIAEPLVTVEGDTYALEIASGANVKLSAGTYTGGIAAIQTKDGDFAALLAPGCAYLGTDGSPIAPADVETAKTVTVGQCTEHKAGDSAHVAGTTTHTWSCAYCGTEETEKCSFTFDENGVGTCGKCSSTLKIVVDEKDLENLVYDGTIKPEDVEITVTLTDETNKALVKDTDYTVVYEPRKDAGEITVTVTGIEFDGTFIKTYNVNRDKPVLEWDTTNKPVPIIVDYDGAPVEASDLPLVIINIESTVDNLDEYLQYSYKKPGDTDYIDGLPTNAGTYDVIVSLPEMPNFEAAVSAPITLTIEAINPIDTDPVAIQPVFNRTEQALVTAGTLCDAAVRDGIEIQFATDVNGPYSTTIPTGTDAGDDYQVWYKVEQNDNYIDVGPTEIQDVKILRKQIVPEVELSEYTYLYDGGYHQPKVTVKDTDRLTVLLSSEYEVEYKNNRDVGLAEVIVSDKAGGNYYIMPSVTVNFEITTRTQETLSITQKPNTVTYGDKFTLSTSGGSGNGDVTWEITSGSDVAKIDGNSGQVTIIGDGTATVKATKSGSDPNSTPDPTPASRAANYEDATATWTFTADKKAVVATVTAEDKEYDSNKNATVHAVVEQGVLPGDEITITGLTGTFSDENAGVDKTVAVVTTGATISGKNSEHYNVSYSSTTVKATIRKAIANITAITPATVTYDGTAHALITQATVDPTDVSVEYALSETGPYSTDIPEATNAGTYTVWYRVKETANYTGPAPESVDVTINKKSVVPTIALDKDSFTYDGTAKEPVVTLTETDGTIPASEYTVEYSNNVNVGTATVTVTEKADGNYTFTSNPVTESFTIKKQQAQVIAPPKAAGDPLTFMNRDQKLVTPGIGTGGTLVYSVDDENGTYQEAIPSETNAREYTVYYKVKGDDNHSDSEVGSVKVTIAPKTVKDPTIELFLEDGSTPLVSYTYDGNAKTPKVVVKDGSDIIATSEYNVIYSDNINAGRAAVNITDNPGGNYTVTGSTTFVILKADITFNPLPQPAVITYDGKPHELLVPGTTSGGEVLYALNSATSTYTAAIPTATEAGKYTVYYKVVGDENHNNFAVQSVPVTIERKPLNAVTIELTPNNFDYDGTVKMPEVKVLDGKTVLPEEEYTWECDNPSPINKGTYTITISDAQDGNYDLSKVDANTASFSIDMIPQKELVIENKPASTNYGDTFTLRTSGGSGTGAVTWAATGPATVANNGDVKITGVGEVTITATNPGDDNYASISAQWTFTAAPKPVTASVTVANKPYDGTANATVSAATIGSNDLVSGDTVTIDSTSITATFDTPSVGTGKTVMLDTSKVEVTGGNADKYEISYPETVTADITQETTQITKSPSGITPLTYSGEPQALITAGETNVGFLVYSLDGTNFSPEIPTGTDAGTYTVYYKVDGTADYTDVEVNTTPISVTIGPKNITPTISLMPVSSAYNGAKQEPVIMVYDGGTVIDKNQYTVTWKNKDKPAAIDVLTDVGTYTANIVSETGGNYSFTVTKEFEIIPAIQDAMKITGKPDHVYYGDTVRLDTIGGTGNGTVTWSITGGATSTITANGELTVTGIGEITVTAERAVPNYGTAIDDWTFTVEPKPVTAEVTIKAKDYDGTTTVADANITAAVKSTDLVNSGDSVTISGLKGTYADANAGTNKTVMLDASNMVITAGSDKYNVSCPATTKGDINRKNITSVMVKLSGNDLAEDTDGTYYYEYDGTEKKPTVTVTDGNSTTLAASDYSVSYSNNKNVSSDAAKATVTVTANANGNYTFSDTVVNFEIRKADAVLTLPPRANDLTYNDEALQELVSAGTVTGGHIEYSLDKDSGYGKDIPTGANAGTYTVYYKVVGDSNHTSNITGQVSVTIKPKEIISPKITVTGSYTYDGTEKKPAVKVEDGTTTIPNTEYNLSYRDNINAGTATVIVTNANGGNYIVNGTGTFVIDKAAASAEKAPEGCENLPYNGTAQELVKAGSVTGGTMVYSLSNTGEYSPAIPTGTAVDNYTVYYKVQGDNNHKDSDPQSVTASIIKNTVTNPTIQVKPETVTYNGEKQEPTVTVQDDNGLVIDGSEYTVLYALKDGTSVTDPTNVGEYTLTITEVVNGNYTFDDTSNQNTATFKILPAGQTPLTITNTRERVYYGDTIQLGTTGGNGTVKWEVDDSSSIANISSGLLEITGVGSVTVTATSTATGYTDQTATWSFYADQKPVTAVVTAKSKDYDSKTDAEVTAKLQNSDLVGDDKIEITLKGSFGDPNVGTDKTVYVDSTAPEFSDDSTGQGNYNITYPATTTASILKADIENTEVMPPTAAINLEYTGIPLTLLTSGGTVTGGTMEYSLDDKTYSVSLPTATDAGSYDIWYRVKGDGNHNDVEGKKLATVTIDPQPVSDPIIEFTPSGASYDGREHKPSVTVKDNHNRVIPAEEYTVTYDPTGDWMKAGKYTVTVTDKQGGNYTFTKVEKEFSILSAGQNPLSITNKPGKVQYGDSFTLSATGGSGTGKVVWSITGNGVASISQDGLVTTLKSGSATVTATKEADDGYDATSDTWSFSVEKKPVTPIVTAEDKEYDTTDTAKLVITWKDGNLLNDDFINLDTVLSGKFNDPNAGTNKTVTISGTAPTDDRYNITLPTSTTASITPKAASVNGSVTAPSLTYNGSEQNLVDSSATVTGGDLVYSRDGSYYTQLVPTEKNAGTYPVWYKAQAEAGGNYKDSPAVRLNVTIKPKEVNSPDIELSPSTFVYDGTAKKPDVIVKDGSTLIPASEYTVSYSNNITVGTATVTITDVDGGNYIVNGTKTFEITAATATLIDAPEPNDLTYNGSAQALVTRGTAENGRVVYSTTEDGPYTTTIPRETNAGTYEVWYKVEGLNSASDTAPDSVSVTIQRKQVTPTILLNNQYGFSTPYTGIAITPTVTVVADGQQLTTGDYSTIYSNNKDVGTATVIVQSTNGNYQFYTVTTFEITKAKATFLYSPKAVEGLVYTGEPQKLVTVGYSANGPVLYSLDAFTYSTSVPTGIERDTYTIFAKVQGNATYEESDLVIIQVKIETNEIENPTIILPQSSFNYTGSAIKPTVTVTDDNGNEIPASEYTVSYSDNTEVGTATVTVKSKGSNYSFTGTAQFEIVGADQSLLEITGKKDTVYYGDTLTLGTTGGSGSGAVTWAVKAGTDVATIDTTTGVVTIKKSGSVTITATKDASGSYAASTAEWTFFAQQKPVNAVVTAADKSYDGDNTAKLTAAISSSALVSGDTVTVTATGHFTDENVGTNKTVIIDSLTVPDEFQAKYAISYPDTVTASITPADAKVSDTDEPEAATGLTYTGSEQNLLTFTGTTDGGNLAYSLNGIDYSFNIPTGTDAKTYSVWYKVIASDGNHKDSAPTKLGDVTIAPNTDTPTILCTPSTFQYDGTEKTPTVVVRDSAQRVIPESEYTVEFGQTPRIAVGKYNVTVTDKEGGNYQFTSPVTKTDAFEIVSASQAPLSIITDKATDVYYGDTFRLSAMGGSGNGKVVWSIDRTDIATINNGVVIVKGIGGFTVEAYREAEGGYSKSNIDSVPFVANPKPVTPVVTAKDKPYDGNPNAELEAAWPSGALVEGDIINLEAVKDGIFDDPNVGTNKRVTITIPADFSAANSNYSIIWPESTTASISKVDAEIENPPQGKDLSFTGAEQELVSPGSTVGGIGTIVYSLSQDGVYSKEIPKASDARIYTVWYKVADSVNYTGIPAAKIEVEIKAASSSESRAVMRTTVQDGTASTVLNAAAGRKLVSEAVAAQSDSIVIKPEITSDVTKAQVSIPASTVSQIKNQTNAALTVSAPIADVTIPNAALETLSSAGGTVSVVTEQVDQAVVLTLTADGKSVEDVPGGVTLTVPAEDAGPGTVAVLVYEDGTRETVRKSVAEDGVVNIPLSGSATVEIVDNSKEFEDVPSTSWASDAVDFASAHELFNGTSETTFSPDQPMSRGMLATVLYNLEGSPAQEQASTFSDVSSDAWYADGVAWAAENGIAEGYGDGQFGPDESITREQFVVMLWKYAGSPKANGEVLSFTDADQVSSYAQEAMCWAVENGILNGIGDGQLAPGGTATRAQAAQMLKRFMENI